MEQSAWIPCTMNVKGESAHTAQASHVEGHVSETPGLGQYSGFAATSPQVTTPSVVSNGIGESAHRGVGVGAQNEGEVLEFAQILPAIQSY